MNYFSKLNLDSSVSNTNIVCYLVEITFSLTENSSTYLSSFERNTHTHNVLAYRHWLKKISAHSSWRYSRPIVIKLSVTGWNTKVSVLLSTETAKDQSSEGIWILRQPKANRIKTKFPDCDWFQTVCINYATRVLKPSCSILAMLFSVNSIVRYLNKAFKCKIP